MSSKSNKNFEKEEKQKNKNKKEEYKCDQHHKNILNKLLENIKEINPPKKLKKINSFICLNIPKSKRLSEKVIVNKNKTEDIERKATKYYNLLSFMKNNEDKSKRKVYEDNSINLNDREECELSKNIRDKNNLHKIGGIKKHNIGRRNFSSSVHRNFILKSDFFKINRSNNITNNLIKKSDCVVTPKRKKINELNNNQFYNYFLNNNLTKNNNNDLVPNNIDNHKNEIKIFIR